MNVNQIPVRMQKIWGVSASGAYIRTVPIDSQIGVQDGAASFDTGFVPDNFTPVAGGGVPPFGQDFNGALNAITAWLQWAQAGGRITFDAAFATAIGGYPSGCVLSSRIVNGVQYTSSVDNNTTDPDDPLTSVGWQRVGLLAGTPVPLLTTGTSGYVVANGTTTGSAASGAAQPGGGTLFVYKAIWDQFSNTQCPIFDSAGGVSTRGANAVADFQANKRLTTPNMKGLGVMGADTMGGVASTFLNGVPVTVGNTVNPGSILGENLHSLSSAENGVHNHGTTDPGHLHGGALNTAAFFGSPGGATNVAGNATINTTTNVTNITINNSGSGTAHNTVERNMVVYWGLKA